MQSTFLVYYRTVIEWRNGLFKFSLKFFSKKGWGRQSPLSDCSTGRVSCYQRHPTEGWPAMHSLIYDIWLVIPKPYENLSPIIASRFSEVIANGSCLETFWCGSCKQLWRLIIYVGTGVETNRYNSCVGFRLNRSLLEDQILFQERATENGPWVMLNVKPF